MKPTGLKRGKMDRKFGQKLFLKPFRGHTPKAAFTRRAYKPGAHGDARVRNRSRSPEYGLQLLEKQRIRALYGISNKYFKRVIRTAEARVREKTATNARNVLDLITEELETRLDNIVYRGGIAPSRSMARQYISHGHIHVNGRRVTIRSAHPKKDDVVSVRPESFGKVMFADLAQLLAKHKPPKWLSVDASKASITVTGTPRREEAMADIELAKVVEFYAR